MFVMKTTFAIPRVLQQYTAGKSELQLAGNTVAALLREIEDHCPALYPCICDETGALRRHLNLFLNDQLLDAQSELDTRLQSGDVVSLFQAVSGG